MSYLRYNDPSRKYLCFPELDLWFTTANGNTDFFEVVMTPEILKTVDPGNIMYVHLMNT